jgi:hypothetical protein
MKALGKTNHRWQKQVSLNRSIYGKALGWMDMWPEIISSQLSVLGRVMKLLDGRGHSGFAMASRLLLISAHAFPSLLRRRQWH